MKYIIVLWFGSLWGFLAVMNGKRIFKEHPDNVFWSAHTFPLALIEVVLDVLFNIIFGTVMFLELPQYQKKEWLFSWRVQRHVDDATLGAPHSWRHPLALWWGSQLNIVDGEHIKGLLPWRM